MSKGANQDVTIYDAAFIQGTRITIFDVAPDFDEVWDYARQECVTLHTCLGKESRHYGTRAPQATPTPRSASAAQFELCPTGGAIAAAAHSLATQANRWQQHITVPRPHPP